jgi:integrase
MSDTALNDYKRHLRAQGYADNTVAAKTGAVMQVARAAGVNPNNLTVQHVEEYFQRRLKPWSRKKYMQHLQSYSRWADLEPLTVGMRPPHIPRGVPKPCSDQALAAVLAVAVPRTRTFLILGAHAGLRAFEIAKVCGEDLLTTPDGWQLQVEGKGGRYDVIPAAEAVVAEVLRIRDRQGLGPLFPGCTAGAVQQAIKRVAAKAGVKMSVHQLRHWFGTTCYRICRDLILVQQMMRHSNPQQTIGYAALFQDDGAKLVAQLPLPRIEDELSRGRRD